MVTPCKVAVAGMAWTTALGSDLDAVWRLLLAGRSGLRPTPGDGVLRNMLAAPVESVGAGQRAQERMVALTLDAASRALAGVEDRSDLALVVGTSLGASLDAGPPATAVDGWLRDAAAALGLRTSPYLVSSACSSGSDAIQVGAELVRAGVAPACLCGGVDILTWSKRLAHSTLGTLSPTMLRAFDRRHDGTLLGEGAGFLLLSRGDAGPALAWLRGAGSASDAAGMTAADASGEAIRLALQRALADAGLEADDLGVIHAHASGTPMNDATEAAAFRDTFRAGAAGPVVFGTKGNFGHTLGATGALGAIALILALRHGEIPPVISLDDPDPAFPLPLARNTPRPCLARLGATLTLGFGGFDTSLIFERAP